MNLRYWLIKFPTILKVRILKKGFELSQSTLVSSFRRPSFTLSVEQKSVELEEDGVRIALTIVDTPGFGDNIDNEFAYVSSFSVYAPTS